MRNVRYSPERILKYVISDMSGYMIWIYKKERAGEIALTVGVGFSSIFVTIYGCKEDTLLSEENDRMTSGGDRYVKKAKFGTVKQRRPCC